MPWSTNSRPDGPVALIAAEPALQRRLSERELDAALEAVADFTDVRSVSRAGHSRGVADLATRAAPGVGLSETDVVAVRRAALLHDIGLHAIPATILDKPGPLSATESERLRMHAYYTERMLARPPVLARLGAIANDMSIQSIVRHRPTWTASESSRPPSWARCVVLPKDALGML